MLGRHINYDTGFLNHQRRAGRVAVLQGSRAASTILALSPRVGIGRKGSASARLVLRRDCRGSATAFSWKPYASILDLKACLPPPTASRRTDRAGRLL